MPSKDPGIQYGPNVKPKAGSQGTLFRGGKPVDEHRYQRGYTPERKADVENRIRFVGPPQLNSQAKDAIARSTAPLHRVERLNVFTAGLPDAQHQLLMHLKGDWPGIVRGSYHSTGDPKRLNIATPSGPVTHEAAENRAKVLMHEYGHFVSDMQGIPRPTNDVNRGKEEGFADSFQANHYRPDPRNNRKSLRQWDMTYRGSGQLADSNKHFQAGYNNVFPDRAKRGNPNPSNYEWEQHGLW